MIPAFRHYWFFVSVILLHAVYFLAAWHYGNICNGDTAEYVYEAVNILERCFFYSGNTALPLEADYLTLRPPGYPLFLDLVYFFKVNNFIVLFLQCLLSVFNIFYCRKIFMSLGYAKKCDFFLLLLLVFFPSHLVYAHLIAPDLLLQTCSLVYVHHSVLFLRDKSVKAAFAMSLALTAGLFIKPVLYPYSFIHFLVIILYSGFPRIKRISVWTASLFPLFCIVMYSYGNQLRTGKFHFSSIQSFNAIYYYHHYFEEKKGMEEADKLIERERRQIAALPTFRERYERANSRGMELLKTNFSSYMSYHLAKSGRFFLETGRGELDEFTGRLTLHQLYSGASRKFTDLAKEMSIAELAAYLREHTSAVFALFILGFNILKLAGVVLFMIYAGVKPVIKWFFTLYLLYFALITGPISNAHYTLPVSLMIMCCALTGYLYAFPRIHMTKTA